MKYNILQTSLYKRELKRAVKRGCDIDKEQLVLVLTRTGSHSDLFG